MDPSTGLTKALLQAVDAAFEAEQVPLVERLVNQPSHTHAKDDVEAAARILDAAAAELGLTIQRIPDPSRRFADHRIYSTPATTEEGRALALVGHIDTVFPRSLGFLEFSRDPDGDVIRGPGTLDMKSGLTVILYALRAVKEVAPERFAELAVRLVCVSDEEVGSPSSSRCVFDGVAAKTSAAMVFEAGRAEDRIVTCRKGGGSFTVTATGRSAHAGNDHRTGRNAIHALALVIPRIEALTDYERGVTVNVGLIEGGTAKNTVPDRASCTIDTRFETAADAEAVAASLRSLAVDPFADVVTMPAKLKDVTFEVSGGVTRPPMEPTPAIQRLRELYERHAATVGLQVGEAPLQGGGSDANLLGALGVPCIDGLGPAGRYYHRVEEWSSLSSLRRRTQALALFLALEDPESVHD